MSDHMVQKADEQIEGSLRAEEYLMGELEDLKFKYRDLQVLFIAAIKSNGGKLTIRDVDIVTTNLLVDKINRRNEARDRCVILTVDRK